MCFSYVPGGLFVGISSKRHRRFRMGGLSGIEPYNLLLKNLQHI